MHIVQGIGFIALALTRWIEIASPINHTDSWSSPRVTTWALRKLNDIYNYNETSRHLDCTLSRCIAIQIVIDGVMCSVRIVYLFWDY